MPPGKRHSRGETVIMINSEQMGHGDDQLGAKLLHKLLFTLASLDDKPGAVIFYNGAVRLLLPDSACLDSLRQLEQTEVDLLACVTCLEFYDLIGKIAVGEVSNMREITQRCLRAAKVITV